MPQLVQVEYQSMRLGKRNTLGPTTLFYLYSIKRRGQSTNLTSYDLEWTEGEVIGSNQYMGHRKGPDMRQSKDN